MHDKTYIKAEIPEIISLDLVGKQITIFCSLFKIYSKATYPQCAVSPF